MASNDRTTDINNSSTSRRTLDGESRYSIHRRAATGGFGPGADVYGRTLPVRHDDCDGWVDPDAAPVAALFDDPERF